MLFLADNLVVITDNKLFAENIFAVFEFDSPRVYLAVKRHCLFQRFEQAHNVNVLGGGKLHSCNRDYPICFGGGKKCRAIFAGVVIGDRQNLASQNLPTLHLVTFLLTLPRSVDILLTSENLSEKENPHGLYPCDARNERRC